MKDGLAKANVYLPTSRPYSSQEYAEMVLFGGFPEIFRKSYYLSKNPVFSFLSFENQNRPYIDISPNVPKFQLKTRYLSGVKRI